MRNMKTEDKEILEVLRREMLLSEARSDGAREAYKQKALNIAMRDCPFFSGNKVRLEFSDGFQMAVFDSIEWSRSWEFRDYEGPALYGRMILKSGKRSRVRQALCTADAMRAGLVKLIVSDQGAEK